MISVHRRFFRKLIAEGEGGATADWVLGGTSPAGLQIVHRGATADAKHVVEVVFGPQHAFLDKRSLADLVAFFKAVHADPDIADWILLRSTGKFFGLGTSIPEHVPPGHLELIPLESRVILGIASSPVPVVAKVHGRALGGFFDLAVASRFVIAEVVDPGFGAPQIKLGVPASDSATMLPRIVGPEHALILLLRGEEERASTLQSWGLVHSRSVDALTIDGLDQRVTRLIAEPASQDRQTLLLRGPREFRLSADGPNLDPDARAAVIGGLAAKIIAEDNLTHSRPVMDMIVEMVVNGWSNIPLAQALGMNAELYKRAMEEIGDCGRGLEHAAANPRSPFPPADFFKHQ